MRYDFDILKLITQYIPVVLRTEKHLAFLKALFSPLVFLKNTFLAYAEAARKEQMQNGQTIRLRNLLNDLYDRELRRIAIVDAFSTGAFFVLSDASDTIISDTVDTIIADEADYDSSVDFVVKVFGGGQNNNFVLSNVADTIISNAVDTIIGSGTTNQIADIENTIKRYKIAGKTFVVENL
ncbi:MAG: hypothetical protein OHK0045_11740 [Raineya sp.]